MGNEYITLPSHTNEAEHSGEVGEHGHLYAPREK